MGMLLHHTWLEQQKKVNKPKPVVRDEDPVKETKEPEAETVKKTGGRRKVSK